MGDTIKIYDNQSKARQIKINALDEIVVALDGTTADVNYPISIDGDSVYAKDIWIEESVTTNWVDQDDAGIDPAIIPFTNLHTRIQNTTTDNPKELFIHFNRSIITNVIGLGCTLGGDFSNVSVYAITSGPTETLIYDGSADSTKYKSLTIQLPVTVGYNALKLTFSTTDDVCLSNIYIPKTAGVVARIQAVKPDGTVVDINSTAGGNLKISIEELENTISTNNNTQLNVSPFLVDEFGNYSHFLGDNIFKGSNISISPEHHEIHCGDSYIGFYTEDLANGGSQTIAVIIPNEGLSEVNEGDAQSTKQYHVIFYVDVEAEMTFIAYEGATLSNNGTAINIANRNRNSSRTDYIGFYYNPTITTTGNVVYPLRRIGSGKQIGGELGRGSEFILRDNTIYLFTITNATTSNNYFNFEINYYVHPGV